MFENRFHHPATPAVAMRSPHQADSKRAAEVLALGEIFEAFGGLGVARQVIADGGGSMEFYDRVGPRIRASGAWDRAAGVTIDRKQLAEYSLGNLVLGRAGLEREVAGTIMTETGLCREGAPIPWAVLTRDFTVGTASEAGNLTDAAARPKEYLADPLRNALALGRLGATIAPGFRCDFSVPRFTSDVSAGFVSETGAASETAPATGLVNFSAKRIGGYVDCSLEALQFGGQALEAWLSKMLRDIALVQLEHAAINGSGTGANPLGVRATPGIGSVAGGINGALLAWQHLVDLEYTAASVNALESSRSGYLVNAKVRRHCKLTQKATGLDFMWQAGARALNDQPVAVTNYMPGDLTKGSANGVCSSLVYGADWGSLLVPIFGTPEVVVDRVSLAPQGLVRIVLLMWMGSGVLQPGSFAKMDDALTS